LRIRDSNALVISNTIRNNSAFLLGGGVWVQRGAPTLQGNQIIGNRTIGLGQDAHGGGVQLESTQATLLDNLLARNVISGTESYGGGLEVASTGAGRVTLMRNRFISNTASIDPLALGFGGGIAVSSGRVFLDGSSLISNTATAGGGGLFVNAGGMFSFTNGVLVANVAAQDGGAIYNTGTFSLSNTTVSGNRAGGMGGGIANSAVVNLVNATVSDNTSGNGAGLFNSNEVNIKNSLIALNLGDNCQGVALFSQGNNLEDGGTCALGQPTDMSNTSPSMGPLGEYGGPTPTHALAAGSPAIDAGDNSACPPVDQRGAPRPVDGDGDGQAVCDIGAYEYGALRWVYLPLVLR
jgi:predicted outer membrane repeat protein